MTRTKTLQRLTIALIVIAVLGALLMLDLSNRGLAWRFFWNQTGEESPLAQVRGMVEWTGNLIRPQPAPDPLVPVQHANVNPFGINTFLQKEVEVEKVDAQLRMISEAGFGWIRQEFPWEDIEVDGRGQFTDTRNDMDGDGERDTIDSFAKYDRFVDLALDYGLQVQARLSNPPHWARAEFDPTGFGPPDDLQDFVNYAVAIAEHFEGRIRHFQVWNEPNIYPEWGARLVENPNDPENPTWMPNAVDPVRYTEMLCRTYEALKQVDPEIVVISGALAPTSSLSQRDMNDFVFLQRMYEAGAGDCFDVLSMQGYGLNSGPTDRRMRPTNVNFARNLYIREIMVANGDAHKPIWISEAAWNPVPEPDVAPDIGDRYIYGQVTPEQAAAYMPLAYERIQREWPWVGVMNYWFFTFPDDSRRNEATYYFRMAGPEYDAEAGRYPTQPVYDAMRDYAANLTPTLYQGVHQVDGHWAIDASEGQTVEAEGAQFAVALQTQRMAFIAEGTDVRVRWRGGPLSVTVDGETQTYTGGEGWKTATIASRMTPAALQITVEAESPVLFDTVTVMDRSFQNLYPLVAVSAALGLVVVVLLGGLLVTGRPPKGA